MRTGRWADGWTGEGCLYYKEQAQKAWIRVNSWCRFNNQLLWKKSLFFSHPVELENRIPELPTLQLKSAHTEQQIPLGLHLNAPGSLWLHTAFNTYMWSAYYSANRELHCFSQRVSAFISTPKGGMGQERERRTGSLSSLQLLLRILVWFLLLARIHFRNRQQVGAASVGLTGLGGHSSGQPVENNTCHQRASLQLGAILVVAAASLAISVHRGTVEPVPKSLYENQGSLLAEDFPRYFGDAKHGRVTKTFFDPISSSYSSFFFPFLTTCLLLHLGSQPWEAKIKPPLCSSNTWALFWGCRPAQVPGDRLWPWEQKSTWPWLWQMGQQTAAEWGRFSFHTARCEQEVKGSIRPTWSHQPANLLAFQ